MITNTIMTTTITMTTNTIMTTTITTNIRKTDIYLLLYRV